MQRIKRILDDLKREGLEDTPVIVIPSQPTGIADDVQYLEDDQRPEFVKKDERGWVRFLRLSK